MGKYSVKLTNPTTGEQAYITASSYSILQNRIESKKKVWEKQYERIREQEAKQRRFDDAEKQTEKAQKLINEYKNLLKDREDKNFKFNWSSLIDNTTFKEYTPTKSPSFERFYKKNSIVSGLSFIPTFKHMDEKSKKTAQNLYDEAMKKYKIDEAENISTYEKEKTEFKNNQDKHNSLIISQQAQYENIEKMGVEQYIHYVLNEIKYPKEIIFNTEIYYEQNGKVLIIDMDLPHTDDLPKTIEYKYIATKDKTEEKLMGVKEFELFYNSVIYQIVLKTIYICFNSDYKNTIDLIVFNGWVNGVDGKNGNDFRNCIVSLQVTKDEFSKINIDKIDPQECFRYLKGISAGNLIDLAPVKPIMHLNTQDNRIIKADKVLDDLNNHTNLAIMDWQQFEVLVRDLIQKEFSREGCKVEVTQASRDNGVDAFAFDEDPIRGGKYVIQAKRYNNLVPVSAVRDLYGTVLNEGAVKGILITTSYYGKESLDFAKNKPLTLINGEELIYMFNKYGYQFKIELTKKQKATSNVPY